MTRNQDLTNQKFGRWTVVEKTNKRKHAHVVYLCKCDCGKYKEIIGSALRSGETKSCGCYKKEVRIKHNLTGKHIYRVWADMLQRCNNKKSNNYRFYGAKGVTVHEDWKEFINFRDWAFGNGYVEGLSIDRIDPFGNYEPSNCRWVTRETQDSNKRNSIFVEVDGEKMTLSQLSRKYNLSYSMLLHRYSVGDRGEKLLEPGKRGQKRNGEIERSEFISLNAGKVSEIKWLINNTKLSQLEISKKYGLSQGMVSRIKLGKSHSEIREKKPDWWDY